MDFATKLIVANLILLMKFKLNEVVQWLCNYS